ncbi:MAG: site-2 protease family protein [Candidatus Aenigmatarchaeota archaeon]
MRFSEREIKEIAVSTAVLAFAFGGLSRFFEALFVVGLGFLAHELLGHKLFAQRLGAAAEYRMWPLGLFLAVIGSLVGVVFAAPGAVYFSPVVRGPFAFTVHRFTKKDVGLVALAGPAVNIALGLVFVALSHYASQGLLHFAAYVSFFMAFFNLLPLPPLDGSKVIAWSLPVWAASILIAAAGYLLI